MPHQALTPVRQPQAPHPGQEGLGFRLNGLGQQPAGAAPQDGRQRVVDRLRLMQRDNGAIACHRRIAPSGGPGRLCHPPRYAAFLTPPSPSFGHSSHKRFLERFTADRMNQETISLYFSLRDGGEGASSVEAQTPAMTTTYRPKVEAASAAPGRQTPDGLRPSGRSPVPALG